MKILGCDFATHIGLVLWDSESGEIRSKSIEIKNQKGFERLQSIAGEFSRTVETWTPDFAVIERLALVRNVDAFICLAEIGTTLKQVLYNKKIEWIDVPPKVLKKFTTFNGNASKLDMAEAVFTRWGFRNTNADIIDAYSLARMGEWGVEYLLTNFKGTKKYGP